MRRPRFVNQVLATAVERELDSRYTGRRSGPKWGYLVRLAVRLVGTRGLSVAGAVASAISAVQLGRRAYRATSSEPPFPNYSEMTRPLKKRKGNEDAAHEDKGSYKQLEKLKWGECGRWLSKSMRIQKILASTIRTAVYRWQNTAAMVPDVREVPLTTYTTGTGATQKTFLPVYLFNLTGMPQPDLSSSDGTAAFLPCPMTRLHRTGNAAADGGNNFRWEWLTQRDFDNAYNTPTWSLERDTQTNYTVADHLNAVTPYTNLALRPAAFIKDVTVKFLLMGAKLKPSRIVIQVWQFQDEDLVPPSTTSNRFDITQPGWALTTSEGYPAEDDGERHNLFWTSQTDNLFGNPIKVRGAANRFVGDTHKVLFSKTFEFNPISNDEADARGHMVEYGLKIGINKMCSYQEGGLDKLLDQTEFLDDDEYDVQRDSASITVDTHKLGRVFLVVKGYSESVQTTGAVPTQAEAALNWPSFDWVIRRKHAYISENIQKSSV